ncbi:hypothetical protein FACS189415_1220 [Bacteroidia bacterium]|nr:hypothetical protein FACS189415_1220 [Bacteroidia bacterium]
MNHAILTENESKRLHLPLPWLICFALYSTWQMGVTYFFGDTLSIDGRVPLPVDIGDVSLLIAAGYILSILVMIFLPRIVVWAQRVTAGVALLSVLALYLPLSPETLATAYYVQCFCCLFMIGFEGAVIVNLFTEKTMLKHILVAYGIASLLVAILQNDVIAVPFAVFRAFSVVALILLLLFFFKLPTTVWPRYVTKSDRLVAPKRLFVRIMLLVCLNCFVTLFGISVSESVQHGVSILFVSSALFGFAAFLLWKRFGVSPLRSGSVMAAISGLGFIAAVASLFVPAFSLVACILLGAGMTCLLLNPFYCTQVNKRYPSRYSVPLYVGIALAAVLIHSALLDAFRDNTTALYIVYLVIAVGLVLLYLMLEPYLLYSFRERASSRDEETAAQPLPFLAPGWQEMLQANAYDRLSDGELDIAGYIMRGYQNEEISAESKYPVETIKTYRKRLYSKLQIHKPRELFIRATRIIKEEEREGQ